MYHRMFYVLGSILSAIVLFACNSKSFPTSEIKDIIPVVNLTAGEKTAIPLQDLFYAEKYDIQLGEMRTVGENISAVIRNDSLLLHPAKDAGGFTFLPFVMKGIEYQIPLRISRLIENTFRLEGDDYKDVTIFGEFNGWNREASPFIQQPDGSLETSISLEPGRYQYKFFSNGIEFLDPANPDSTPNGFGGFNSLLTIEPRYDKIIEVFPENIVELADSIIVKYNSIVSKRSQDKKYFGSYPPFLTSTVMALVDNMALPSEWWPGIMSALSHKGSIPKSYFKPGQSYTLRFVVYDIFGDGPSSLFQQVIIKDGRVVGTEPEIQSNYDRVIYSLMVDRFRDSDPANNWKAEHAELDPRVNYHGGDLKGVVDALKQGYFDSLGVNTLWLSPVIQNTQRVEQEFPKPHRWFTSYHGYWPTDPEKVDARFGDMALLKEVVAEAEKHNTGILLDFVSNHAHRDHPWFTEHRDWFGKLDLPDGRKNLRFWDEFRLTTWFEPYLPSFDYIGSPEALEAMTNNAMWWLQKSGAAGFRHDAVKHVPNRFWRTLTRKIRKMDKQRDVPLFQIGETFGGYDLISSYVNNGQLNSQFNFNLFDVARNTFLRTDASFADLEKEIQKTFEVYGVNHLMGNPINSHDKVRYLSYADGDLSLDSGNAKELAWNNPPQVDDVESYRKMRLYMAYMMCIPGIPIVYYGDEVGLTGSEDPDNRRPMRFGNEISNNEKEMLRESRKLIQLRKKHSALRYGDYHSLRADKECLVFIRSDFNEKLVVAFNKSGKDVRAEVPFGILNSTYSGLGNLIDVRTGTQADKSNRNYTIMIPAGEWGIWKYFEAKQ